MKTQQVRVQDAVGLPLAYDLTEIVPGQRKGAVLRRGHIIRAEDLPVLARIGKSLVLVLEMEPGEVHEDEAALRLANMLGGSGVRISQPGEAWADLRAERGGLLKVDAARLLEINQIGELLVATRHNNDVVKAGELVAKAKVVGLVVQEWRLRKAAGIAATAGTSATVGASNNTAGTSAAVGDGAGSSAVARPVIQVIPFQNRQAAIIVTGREVYEGRVKDAFGPLLASKLAEYGSIAADVTIVPDVAPEIAAAIREALDRGADLVLVTGGMSPDDSTPEGVRQAGAKVEFYGMPVSPGAMTLMAYADRVDGHRGGPGDVPIMGVPAGLLAKGRGIFDVLLPRLLAGERLRASDMARYGHGGLCPGCQDCTFPMCAFGKGI